MFLGDASVCLVLSCNELLAEVKTPLRAFEEKMWPKHSVRCLGKKCVWFRVQGESLVHAHFHFTRKSGSRVLWFERKKNSVAIVYLVFRCGKIFVLEAIWWEQWLSHDVQDGRNEVKALLKTLGVVFYFFFFWAFHSLIFILLFSRLNSEWNTSVALQALAEVVTPSEIAWKILTLKRTVGDNTLFYTSFF